MKEAADVERRALLDRIDDPIMRTARFGHASLYDQSRVLETKAGAGEILLAAMRILLQRVTRAEVRIGEQINGRIGVGFVLLVGFTHTDGEEQVVWMADKIVGLRIFADDED